MSQYSKSTMAIDLVDRLNVSKSDLADCTFTADSQANTYSETYFDALYSGNSDPWQYQTRWYEKRKRDMCLAVLPQAKYDTAIELGCGNGVFSALLAHRCQSLLSIDGNNQAVQLAKHYLAECSHAKVIQGVIPEVLFRLKNGLLENDPLSASDSAPAHQPPFDLIIISEILYYLSPNDIDTVIDWIKQKLAIGGTLLCCHWRYAIDGFSMTGETVHERLCQAFDGANHRADMAKNHQTAFTHPTFTHQSQLVDSDFLLDVWQNAAKTVAMQENLV